MRPWPVLFQFHQLRHRGVGLRRGQQCEEKGESSHRGVLMGQIKEPRDRRFPGREVNLSRFFCYTNGGTPVLLGAPVAVKLTVLAQPIQAMGTDASDVK